MTSWTRPRVAHARPTILFALVLVALPLLASGAFGHITFEDEHSTEDSHARLSMHTDTWYRDPGLLWGERWHDVCFTLENIHDSERISLPYSDPWRIENESGVRMAGQFGYQAIFHYDPGESTSACWDVTRPVYSGDGHVHGYEEAPPGEYTLHFPFIVGYGTDDAEPHTLSLAFTLVDETGDPWPLGP